MPLTVNQKVLDDMKTFKMLDIIILVYINVT